MNKNNIIFISITSVLLLVILIIENINGRFWLNDFKVFYSAAEALISNKPVYGIPFGLDTGYYKYSPLTLLFFVPFAILPYAVAAIIQYVFICIATIYVIKSSIALWVKFSPKLSSNKYTPYLLLLCFVVHLVRELHLGNINLILVALILLALNQLAKNKLLFPSLLIAIVILAKPYFIILCIPIFIAKKIKSTKYIIMSLSFLVLTSLVLIGFNHGIKLYANWLTAMLAHSDYLVSNHTIFGLIKTYFQVNIPNALGLPLLLVLSFVFGFYVWRLEKNVRSSNATLFGFTALIIALIPNILITDTEHFLFSIPFITFILLNTRNKILPIFLMVLLMFLYGGNSSDLLGRSLSSKFEQLGVLGLANLTIIILGFSMFYRSIKQQQNDLIAGIKTT